MSIIIRNNPGGGGVGSYKGFPPGDVNIIDYNLKQLGVRVKWEDPDEVIVCGSTVSTWAGTILVRKEGSYPTSPKDGVVVINNTTKDAYKDTYLEDNNLTLGTTYYYRFYTYNSDKIYNDSSDMMFSKTIIDADSVLANNSWSKISEIAETGDASSFWSVGDEIDVTISGTYSGTYTLQIWDFNHFDKTDGSGKAGITFGLKDVVATSVQMNNTSDTSGGWNKTTMKKTVMANILSSMPTELQSIIKEVNTYSNAGGNSESNSPGLLSTDKVFIPGFIELFGISYDTNEEYVTQSNQFKFPIFTDNASRIKLTHGKTSANWYWTRSPASNTSWSYIVVASDGDNSGYRTTDKIAFCFCFNV